MAFNIFDPTNSNHLLSTFGPEIADFVSYGMDRMKPQRENHVLVEDNELVKGRIIIQDTTPYTGGNYLVAFKGHSPTVMLNNSSRNIEIMPVNEDIILYKVSPVDRDVLKYKVNSAHRAIIKPYDSFLVVVPSGKEVVLTASTSLMLKKEDFYEVEFLGAEKSPWNHRNDKPSYELFAPLTDYVGFVESEDHNIDAIIPEKQDEWRRHINSTLFHYQDDKDAIGKLYLAYGFMVLLNNCNSNDYSVPIILMRNCSVGSYRNAIPSILNTIEYYSKTGTEFKESFLRFTEDNDKSVILEKTASLVLNGKHLTK